MVNILEPIQGIGEIWTKNIRFIPILLLVGVPKQNTHVLLLYTFQESRPRPYIICELFITILVMVGVTDTQLTTSLPCLTVRGPLVSLINSVILYGVPNKVLVTYLQYLCF